jgi:hypothetical protein
MLHTQFSFERSEGQIDKAAGRQRAQSAPFESMSCVIAEVEARVAACGEAGEALADESPQVNNRDQLSRPARRALDYCSGNKRRRLTYAQWKRQQKERQEGRR